MPRRQPSRRSRLFSPPRRIPAQSIYGSAQEFGGFLTADTGAPNPRSPGSWNRYTYVMGDPINRTDPGGHDCYENYWDSDCPGYGQPIGGCWANEYEPGPVTDPDCYEYGPEPPDPAPPPAPARTYFLVVSQDCYDVPSNGGAVTREITFELDFLEAGMPRPMFTSQGTISEHLVGDLPTSGANSGSTTPGKFRDEQSITGIGAKPIQHVVQTFSVLLNNASIPMGLAIAAFGGTVADPVGQLDITKYAGYVSINGNTGGRIDRRGKLVRGTYTPCP